MLPRGATIGILGDGQLGRMIAQAAQRKGFKVHGFGQDRHSPLGQVTAYFTQANFDDTRALEAFAAACDVVTSEFENVPLPALEATACKPAASIFALAQDRHLEKQAAQSAGLTTAPTATIDTMAELEQAVTAFGGKGILKTRRMGYDGKGQWRIDPQSNLPDLWEATPKADLILEGFVEFAFETSVLVVRNRQGQVVTFPCGENVHRDGILHQSIVPGQITPAIQAQADQWGKTLADSLALEGLLAIEFFVLSDGSLVFNEMAPRPHNSGHWTMEGADQSQFDVLVDALTNVILIAPRQLAPTTMTNLLGDEILERHSGHLHDYGKARPKAGRKMGHVTQVTPNP